MQQPQIRRQLQVFIKGAAWTFAMPTVGGVKRIEMLKSLLSSNNYAGLISNGTESANFTLDVIDMQAYIAVCCPDLNTSLNTTIDEMDLADMAEMRKIFRDQIYPWVKEWESLLKVGDQPASEAPAQTTAQQLMQAPPQVPAPHIPQQPPVAPQQQPPAVSAPFVDQTDQLPSDADMAQQPHYVQPQYPQQPGS